MSDIGPFPDNLIVLLKEYLSLIPGVTTVVDRSLGPEDANGSVGIEYREWRPIEVEMGGRGGFDPSLSGYVIQIEHLVKAAEREAGNKTHREVARGIRSMLYRNPEAQVAFRQLNHSVPDDYIERLMKWQLTQSFANNKIQSAFYFVSGTLITFETETV